ncbi:hypothetical protein SIK47_04810, partial [Clostridioides difficile]|nr:hypothetical protein [Clostridioides difficile]
TIYYRGENLKKNYKIHNLNEYKNKKKNNYKKSNKKKIGAKCILLIATFSVIILNLCGYSKISEMKYDIYYLQKDLRKKEIVLEELKAKETEKTSIKEIELKAKELLNMDYPKDGQIKYIDVDN